MKSGTMIIIEGSIYEVLNQYIHLNLIELENTHDNTIMVYRLSDINGMGY